ncbi:hypothetical protein DID88_009112 [Monilinia fructigena]|uniref:Fungal N-terminal domain-containing protein n=1 Tax=Monilinia fructigena TaxID=38457 RepID=A0A395IEK6_9HELO|nr:hypothetical protein DID88_009112 [Monilinia fructigena]
MAEAAVAAVNLGASVIGFIGLTGQILQGCQFVCGCLDDIKGAPMELQNFIDQVKSFESGIRSFRYSLEKAAKSIDISLLEEKIKLSLKLGQSTIRDLRDLVNNHKHNGKRDWWKGIKFAKKKNIFTKYVNRLNQVKIALICAQSNLSKYFRLLVSEKRWSLTNLVLSP